MDVYVNNYPMDHRLLKHLQPSLRLQRLRQRSKYNPDFYMLAITRDLKYYIETKQVRFEEIEPLLRQKVGENPEIYISLHVDESVPMKEVVRVMNIAKDNKYKLILATRAK